jgi:hypothetical protein
MWSWLFGDKETKNEESKTNLPRPGQPGKPRKQQWVQDGKGGWIRSDSFGTSTTTALVTLLEPLAVQTATTLVASLLTSKQQSKESIVHSLGDNASPQLDGSPEDPASSLPGNQGQDALAAYQQQLTRTGSELQAALEKWKLLKEQIIGDDMDLKRYANEAVLVRHHQSVLESIRNFFRHLFEKIKEDLEPADLELHEMLDKAHQEVQGLCEHLDESCKLLKDTSTSEENQHKISIDMCNTSMTIINDLIGMVDNIQSEIKYCLEAEKITENAAKKLILLAILIVTKIPLPDIELTFSDSYRNFLYNEIEETKKSIDIFESDVIRALKLAMAEIKKKELEWEESRKHVEARPLSESGKLVVFKPQSDVSVNTTSAQEVKHTITNSM